MNANELRLGNWIIGEYTPVGTNIKETFFAQVHEILQTGVRVLFDGHAKSCNTVSEIPLTPEILTKCGFDNNNINGCSYNYKNFKVLRYIKKNSFLGCGVEIKSLHQLQNLYFALTGEALPCTL